MYAYFKWKRAITPKLISVQSCQDNYVNLHTVISKHGKYRWISI